MDDLIKGVETTQTTTVAQLQVLSSVRVDPLTRGALSTSATVRATTVFFEPFHNQWRIRSEIFQEQGTNLIIL